jgi:hypothetical protein
MIPTQISPQEFHLFKREVESLGEDMTEEQMERRLQVSHLKLELEAIKQVLVQHWPDFLEQCEKTYAKMLLEYDPDSTRNPTRRAG